LTIDATKPMLSRASAAPRKKPQIAKALGIGRASVYRVLEASQ
jgi:predicted DNA-binding transcriptional regulator AlpA